MLTTSNLGLKKPEGTDVVDVNDFNGNADILDAAVAGKVDKVSGKQLSTEDYTAAEKSKLAGVAAGANNYVHPANHPASVIVQDGSNRFVTDAEKSVWNGKAGSSVATTTADGLMAAADKQLSANRDGYGTTAGSATAYTVSLSPAPTLVDGLRVTVKVHAANTGAATINVNGLGAKSILKGNGNALTSGNLKVNSVYTLVYNGTAFILQGEGGEYGTAVAADVLAGKTIGTENGIFSGLIQNNGATNLQASLTSDILIPSGYYNGEGKVIRAGFTAGSINKLFVETATLSTNQTVYTKLVEKTVHLNGTYRITFTLGSSTNNQSVYARIYINGIPSGQERERPFTDAIPFSENIFCSSGDKIQIYARSTNSSVSARLIATYSEWESFSIAINERFIS